MYQPAEDSWLLLETIKKLDSRFGRALDIGTGTGLLAEELAKICEKVVAADIDAEALEDAKGRVKAENVEFVQSDLFQKITGKFDLIVFNPPYLPPEPGGGREYSGGVPLIQKFLKQATAHLEPGGKILLLFSSRTGMVDEEFTKLGYQGRKITGKRLFFEQLWVYELKPA